MGSYNAKLVTRSTADAQQRVPTGAFARKTKIRERRLLPNEPKSGEDGSRKHKGCAAIGVVFGKVFLRNEANGS